MSSAPSVPGVEVGAPWLGSCEHVLTAGALEMLATLNGTFGPRRAELPESRGPRGRAGRGVLPEFLADPEDAQLGRWRLAPGLADHRVGLGLVRGEFGSDLECALLARVEVSGRQRPGPID